jgi:hypothetical protein
MGIPDGWGANDKKKITKLYPDPVERALLIHTWRQRNSQSESMVGKAFEQYALEHSDVWGNTDPNDTPLLDVSRGLRNIEKNIREARPTYDKRVAIFEVGLELSTKGVQQWFDNKANKEVVTRGKTNKSTIKSVCTKMRSPVFFDKLLYGDNREYWTSQRVESNLDHFGYFKAVEYTYGGRSGEKYPFLITPQWLRK